MKYALQYLWVRSQAALKREDGQGMVEYGLIIALVAIGLVLALTTLKDNISTVFGKIGCTLNPAGTGC